MTRRSDPRTATLRVAGIATFIGGVVAIIVNALHPRPPEQTDELLTLVASMPHWSIIHYLAAFATPLILAGLGLLVRTLEQPTARAVGEVGKYVTLIGAAAFAVAIVIDGYGYPYFASQWSAATGEEKAAILWAATAVHTADVALFPVWAGMFMGMGLVLVAAALWQSGEYPRMFAVVGMLGGSMCFVFAVSGVVGTRVPLPLWPLGPAINGLWLVALGAMLLSRSMVHR